MTTREAALLASAKNLRQAIGKSKTYGVGWLARGEDEVVQACRDFDAAKDDLAYLLSQLDAARKVVEASADAHSKVHPQTRYLSGHDSNSDTTL